MIDALLGAVLGVVVCQQRTGVPFPVCRHKRLLPFAECMALIKQTTHTSSLQEEFWPQALELLSRSFASSQRQKLAAHGKLIHLNVQPVGVLNMCICWTIRASILLSGTTACRCAPAARRRGVGAQLHNRWSSANAVGLYGSCSLDAGECVLR